MLCQDKGHKFPQAKEVIEERTYMNDSFVGANNLEEAKVQQEQVAVLLKAGGFELGKWAANHSQLLSNVNQERVTHSPCTIEDAEIHCVLGLVWHPASDIFTYKLNWPTETTQNLTKRKVLSQAAKLYDPLGWISPIIITLKICMQSLWAMGVQCDNPIPDQRAEEWRKITEQLTDLPQISIPRHVGDTSSTAALEIHGFTDASEKAMAAVVYLRMRAKNSITTCNILASKIRVAPLKQVSLPRLELSAAFMLAKLVKNQVEDLSLKGIPTFLWSDSTAVLSWVQGHPKRWTTYVENRVSSIWKDVPDAVWSHVAGSINPADLASRGTSVQGLLSTDYWLLRPEFLRATSIPWRVDANFTPLDRCPEERRTVHVVVKADDAEWDLLKRYSSLETLLRVTARCQQFVVKLKNRIGAAKLCNLPALDEQGQVDVISPEQMLAAELFWMRHVQALCFWKEIKTLINMKCLPKRSELLKLHPFLDGSNLLCIGGRLKNALRGPA